MNRTLQIFVSSPGDVAEERQIVGRVISQLQGKYWSFVRLEDVFWESSTIRATGHYQDELINPGDCDIVLGILWSRLGSPLPEKFKGLRDLPPTGTEWELEEAFRAYEENGCESPDIIIYRRDASRPAYEEAEKEEQSKQQWAALESYLDQHYLNDDAHRSIKRPITKYCDFDSFEKLLRSNLEELILRKIPVLKTSETFPPISGCPFKELKAFDYHDRDRFFGRTRDIRKVQKQLRDRHEGGNAFVLIYGGSGYGKSSLMQAGVAPVVCREGGVLDEAKQWRRVLFQPAARSEPLLEHFARRLLGTPTDREWEEAELVDHFPLSGLAEMRKESLPEALTGEHGIGETWDVANLSRTLSDEEDAIFAVAAIQDHLEKVNCFLLLELDQFEEALRDPYEQSEGEAFCRVIHALCRCPRVMGIATMRSDAFPEIGKRPALKFLVGSNGDYILPPPSAQMLNEVIRFPAIAARVAYETRVEAVEINGESASNDNLAEQIFHDAKDHPDALPLLEFCLTQLWTRGKEIVHDAESEVGDYGQQSEKLLLWEDYLKMGGFSGAIAKAADSVLNEIQRKQPIDHALGRLFSALVRVDPSSGEATRRRPNYQALADDPELKALVEAFQEERLLTSVQAEKGEDPQIFLAHDSLITHWPILADWIAEHRADLAAHERLVAQAKQWKEENRAKGMLLSEKRLAEAEQVENSTLFNLNKLEKEYLEQSRKRATRRLRTLQIAVAVFACVAMLAAGLGWVARQASIEAGKSAKEAEKRAHEAEREYYWGQLKGAGDYLKNGEFHKSIESLASCPEHLRKSEWEFLAQVTPLPPVEIALGELPQFLNQISDDGIRKACTTLLKGGGSRNNKQISNGSVNVNSGANGGYAGVVYFKTLKSQSHNEEELFSFSTHNGGPEKSLFTDDGSLFVVLSNGGLDGGKIQIGRSRLRAEGEYTDVDRILILPVPNNYAAVEWEGYISCCQGYDSLLMAQRKNKLMLEAVPNDLSARREIKFVRKKLPEYYGGLYGNPWGRATYEKPCRTIMSVPISLREHLSEWMSSDNRIFLSGFKEEGVSYVLTYHSNGNIEVHDVLKLNDPIRQFSVHKESVAIWNKVLFGLGWEEHHAFRIGEKSLGSYTLGGDITGLEGAMVVAPFFGEDAAFFEGIESSSPVRIEGEITRAQDFSTKPTVAEWGLSPDGRSLGFLRRYSTEKYMQFELVDTGEGRGAWRLDNIDAFDWIDGGKSIAVWGHKQKEIVVKDVGSGADILSFPRDANPGFSFVMEHDLYPDVLRIGSRVFSKDDLAYFYDLPENFCSTLDGVMYHFQVDTDVISESESGSETRIMRFGLFGGSDSSAERLKLFLASRIDDDSGGGEVLLNDVKMAIETHEERGAIESKLDEFVRLSREGDEQFKNRDLEGALDSYYKSLRVYSDFVEGVANKSEIFWSDQIVMKISYIKFLESGDTSDVVSALERYALEYLDGYNSNPSSETLMRYLKMIGTMGHIASGYNGQFEPVPSVGSFSIGAIYQALGIIDSSEVQGANIMDSVDPFDFWLSDTDVREQFCKLLSSLTHSESGGEAEVPDLF